MTRSLPSVQVHAPYVAAASSGSALPAFDVAVAAHAFEPELAVGVGVGARREVRLVARSRRFFRVVTNLLIGVALLILWTANRDAQNGTNNVFLGDLLSFSGFAWVVAALGLTVHGNSQHEQLFWLRDGKPIAGYVCDLHIDDRGEVYHYFARIRYWRDHARSTEDDISITKSVYDHLFLGATLTLIQHPENKDRVRPYYQFTDVEAI